MDTLITTYGAIGDGKTVNTGAIQSAIDAAAAQGGGRVVVPTGCFVTGTLWLRDRVELHLTMGAILKASTDFADFNAEDAYPQNFGSKNEGWRGTHLIIGYRVTDVAVTGHGLIDGSGDFFFEEPQPCTYYGYTWAYGFARERDKELRRHGPMLCFVESSHIRVTDLRMENSCAWTNLFHGCAYVTVRGLHILNKKYHVNTDGLDIDTCRYVTVSDCHIDTGDDAIAIRCDSKKLQNGYTACEHVTITNCTLASSSSVVRVGVGTGSIRHVTMSNLTMYRGGEGFNLITAYGAGGQGFLSDISIENVSMDTVARPLFLYERNEAHIRHVRVAGIRCRGMCGIAMACEDEGAVSDITVKDIDLTFIDPPHPLCPQAIADRGNAIVRLRNTARVTLSGIRTEIPETQKDVFLTFLTEENCKDTTVIQ